MHTSITRAIIIPGHAAFRSGISTVPASLTRDEHWALEPYQSGEPPFFIEHIAFGIQLLAKDPASLLIFSGGRTRKEAGEWSEAGTYTAVARHLLNKEQAGTDADSVILRTESEPFARDSFENLLFGICTFALRTGIFPDRVSVVGWRFKSRRFGQHRSAIRYPAEWFTYHGVNDPADVSAARGNESVVHALFEKYPYGTGGELKQKKIARTPFYERHPYNDTPGLEDFFSFIEDERNARRLYPGRFPWER